MHNRSNQGKTKTISLSSSICIGNSRSISSEFRISFYGNKEQLTFWKTREKDDQMIAGMIKHHFQDNKKSSKTPLFLDCSVIRKTGNIQMTSIPEMMVPGALGTSTVISESMNQDIGRVYQDEPRIGAKYYHVYGGAHLACQLIRKGVSAERTIQLQKLAARAYRAIGFCQGEKKLRQTYSKLKAHVSSSKGKYKKVSDLPDREFQNIVGVPENDPNIPETFNRQSEYIAMAAAEVRNNWHFLGNVLPCETLNTFESNSLDPKYDADKLWKMPCGSDYTEKDCVEIKRVLHKQAVDMEWTVKQHELGAKFAAKNCKPSKQSATANACTALESLQIDGTYSGQSPAAR